MYRKVLPTALAILLLATICNKKEVIKDTSNKSYILDSDQAPIPLSAAWKAELSELPRVYKEQREKLKNAIERLTLEARASLKEILDAIVSKDQQGELLHDISGPEFTPEEVLRLLIVVLSLKDKAPEAVMEACKSPDKVSFWAKVKLHALESELSPEDQKLFDRLEEAFKTEDLLDNDV